MRCLWSVVAIVVVGCITPASAQVQNVNRTASGQPDTDIRVGVYVNVRPDCTSGPLPSIQLTSPPENGKVTVKKAKVTATNYKQCLALDGSPIGGHHDNSFYRDLVSAEARDRIVHIYSVALVVEAQDRGSPQPAGGACSFEGRQA